jgi:hypothetical protein
MVNGMNINWTLAYDNPRWCKTVYMSPSKFLSLAIPTPSYDMGSIQYLSDTNEWSTPYLRVDIDTGRVLEHEGRHRCHILEQKGVKKIPVQLCFYKREDEPSMMWGVEKRRLRPIDAINYPISKCNIKVSQLKPEQPHNW